MVEIIKIIAKERDKVLLEMVKSVHKMNHVHKHRGDEMKCRQA